MANGHGGARTPSNPAPVSGPGAMSRRTDGGPAQPARYVSGGNYGDGQELMSIQQAAPMASSQTQTQAPRSATPTAPMPTPLDAPSERPDEPVTEGNPLGPGSGPSVLSGGNNAPDEWRQFKQFLPLLTDAANAPGASQQFVKFVHRLRGA